MRPIQVPDGLSNAHAGVRLKGTGAAGAGKLQLAPPRGPSAALHRSPFTRSQHVFPPDFRHRAPARFNSPHVGGCLRPVSLFSSA